MLPDGYSFRPLVLDDAPALAAAYVRNREHLGRWDPVRPESFFTAEGQAAHIGSGRGWRSRACSRTSR